MKIGIITPLESHHRYLIKEIYKKYKNIIIIKDKKKIKPPFKNNYINLKKQENYESERWFKDKIVFPKKKLIRIIYDINNKKNIKIVKEEDLDLLITFGSIKLRKEFTNNFKKNKIINLHGGDPNYYRGLDSHLWSIYHGDYKSIQSCLHYVSEKLDTGKIIQKKRINLKKNTKLHQLRCQNTELLSKWFLITLIN